MAPFDSRSPCAADALSGVTPLNIGGKTVGILGLAETVREVCRLGLADDTCIRAALIERAGRINFIPASLTDVYAEGLLAYYRKWGNEDSKRGGS